MRSTVVEALVDVVSGLQLGHPTRVGIDGRSAAGKTTLANELAATIQLRGREVLRAELDDFHRPGHKFRSMRGEWTPHSYYAESYDYAAARQLLLEPLGPGGNRRCRTRLFDSYHDVWLPEEWPTPRSGRTRSSTIARSHRHASSASICQAHSADSEDTLERRTGCSHCPAA